jgi:hypothetical protein
MAATPEEFTAAAVARLGQLHPPPEVTVVAPLVLEVARPGHAPAVLRLQNLWWAHLSDPSQLRARLDQLAVGVSGAAADAPLEPGRLVPVVRARDGFSETSPVQHLAGPLWVGLALDGDHTRRLVRRIDADMLRMPDARLFLVARANLGMAAETLRRERLGPVTRLHFDGDLDSSLLVLRPLWQAVVQAVGGPVVVAAPARGALVYASVAAADALQQTARHLRRMMPWPLPMVVLVTNGAGWAEVRASG